MCIRDREYTFRGSISEIEERMAPYFFFRVHKSYVVNLGHIKTIAKSSLLMENGDSVFLSKHRSAKLYEALLLSLIHIFQQLFYLFRSPVGIGPVGAAHTHRQEPLLIQRLQSLNTVAVGDQPGVIGGGESVLVAHLLIGQNSLFVLLHGVVRELSLIHISPRRIRSGKTTI